MHILKIGEKDINTWALVSKISYKPYSRKNIYYERAGVSPAFLDTQKTAKEIEVELIYKDRDMNFLNLQAAMESKIITDLKTTEPTWIQIDSKFFLGVLDDIEDKDLYDGILIARYIALNGVFYSTERTANLGAYFTLNGLEDSSMAKIKLTATTSTVSVSLNGKTIKLLNVPTNQPIEIDLNNMTAKQAGAHLRHDLLSEYFNLKLGSNRIAVSGGSGTVTYREVLGV